jgi:nucleotidyltransferase/DNA polymerase involved in DNA repair
MLWTCLLFSSLPLDVFARAIAPDDARPFVVGSGGHYPRVVAANVAARAAGIRAEQLISSALALAPGLSCAIATATPKPRARATRHNGADVHADSVPRAAECDRRGHRREPAPVRHRPAPSQRRRSRRAIPKRAARTGI